MRVTKQRNFNKKSQKKGEIADEKNQEKLQMKLGSIFLYSLIIWFIHKKINRKIAQQIIC